MTAERFRRDRFLRASGYNLYVWGSVNLLVTWPLWSAVLGRAWHPGVGALYLGALLGAGVFVSVLNDNRVAKMWGAPHEVALVDAPAFWGPTLLLGVVLSAVLAVRGPAAYLVSVWLLLVGSGYLTWGNFGVQEFRWFGSCLIAAGAVVGLSTDPAADPLSPAVLLVWMLFMGMLWFPFGAHVNRRYVHPVGPPALGS